MRIRKKILSTVVSLTFLIGLTSSVYATNYDFKIATKVQTNVNVNVNVTTVVEKVGNGSIDWTNGVIKVKGSGAAPAQGTLAQKRLMAIRAAQADAYRQLAEIINGVRVDSTTVVKNFVTESDEIRTQVSGLVKGARMVGEPKYFDDGSVEIEMQISLYGPKSLFDIIDNRIFDRQNQTPQTSEPTPYITPPIMPSPPVIQTPQPVPTVQIPGNQVEDAPTGLIIDCRGLGVQPSMAPSIKDQSGREIYIGNLPIDPDFVVNIGIVGYATSPQQAQKNVSRIGNKPLVIKALKAGGPLKADIIIKNEHAQAILQADSINNFLKNAGVIILL